MSKLRQWWYRILGTMTGSSAEDRLKTEIDAHLDQLADDFVTRGMAPDDARLAARRAFGGVDQIREVYRDQQGLPSVGALVQDVRFGLRLLLRDRGFTLAAVVVLGIGLGINNLFFTLVYAATMRGLPLEQADRHGSVLARRCTKQEAQVPGIGSGAHGRPIPDPGTDCRPRTARPSGRRGTP